MNDYNKLRRERVEARQAREFEEKMSAFKRLVAGLGGRNAPVERDDVHLENYGRRILTAPVDAYELGEHGAEARPIMRLWEPLLAELRRASPYADTKPPALWPANRICVCERCAREFFSRRNGAWRFCSPACRRDALNEAGVGPVPQRLKLSRERAARRADRQCEHCGQPFTPQRATGRFCSPRCRVAHHRAN
jgi:hypothetical protein